MLLFVALIAGLLFWGASYRFRLLNGSGAVAGGLFAFSLVGLGGWTWIAPAVVFFLLSSLLSHLPSRRRAEAAARAVKGNVRDAGQVLANGGVAWLLLLLYAIDPRPAWYLAYLGAFAAAAADTWATEIGTLSRRMPRLITTGRRVPGGTSGAISITGSLGALAGAWSVGISAVAFLPEMAPGIQPWAAFGLVVSAGTAASFIDSLVGATLQGRYRDPASGGETEHAFHAGRPNDLVRGVRFVNNDRVNLIGTLFGAVVVLVCFPPW